MSLIDWLLEPFHDLAHRWRAQRDPDSLAFDRRLGVETASFDWLGNYEPARPDLVETVLDALHLEPGRWAFVDLGSGKGRVVLIAAQRPFARVVGIEYRAVLHRRAQANLAAFAARHPEAAPVTLRCGDATSEPLPDGPLVLFLYNPFGPAVLGPLLARVADREDVVVAYLNPIHAAVVEAYGFTEARRGGTGTGSWRIYHRA